MALDPSEWEVVDDGFNASEWEVVGEEPVEPATTRPSWGQSTEFVGKSLAQGAAKNLDLFGSVFSALQNPVGAILGQNQRPSMEALSDKYIGTPESSGVFGPAANIARSTLGAVTFPAGGVVGNALAGAGAGIGSEIAPDSAIAPLVGALAPSAIGGAIGGISRVFSNPAKEAARKLELSAFGANKSRIAKAYERAPEVLDEMGKPQNPISTAISAFKSEGGGAKSLEGQALLDDLASQSEKFGSELNTELTKASALQKDAIVPAFNNTFEYIKKLPGASKDEAKAIADDLISKTVNNTDGTLISLQKEKIALNPLIKDSAYGSNANPLKTNILKHIRSDLRQSIEDGYAAATGNKAEKIANLNKELGHRETLRPLLEDIRNTGEARDFWRWFIDNWKTTGGFGAATLLAGATTGPGAAVIPLMGAAATTPAGRLALAKGLTSTVNAGTKAGKNALKNLPAAIAIGTGVAQDRSLDSKKPEGQAKGKSSLDSILTPEASATSQVFSRPVEQEIDADPFASAVYETESGRNPKAKNPNSTAKGGFQFIDKTAKAMGLEDPMDLKQSFKAFKQLTSQHQKQFGDNPVLLYSAHYLGSPLLKKVLNQGKLTDKEQQIVKELGEKALPRFVKIYQSKVA